MKLIKKNNVFIIMLIAIIVFMSVGFAILSTTLNINGQTKIKSQTWDIHFENVKVTDGSVVANKSASITNEELTLVEYEIELTKPGDFYEFTVDVVNDGTLDAKINTVVMNGISGYEEYINYQVTYLDGTEIKTNDTLASGVTDVYKVRVEYKKDLESLPDEDIIVNLTFATTYVQVNSDEVVETTNQTSYNAGYEAGYQAALSDPTNFSINRTLLTTFAGAWNNSTLTYDATGLTNYQNLTADNFAVEVVSVTASNSGDGAKSCASTSTKTYNAETGVLTITGLGCRNSERWTMGGVTIDLYLLSVGN